MSNKVVKPSSKPRGRKIPETDWNEHRDIILHLWLEDGEEGRTIDEIVEIMRRERNFVATASQYHNRIVKKWCLRKNATKAEWRKLYWNEVNRKSAGKSIRVLFNGRTVPDEKKRREWERYGFASEVQPEVLSPLPEAFEYRPLDTESAASTSRYSREVSTMTSASQIHIIRQGSDISRSPVIRSQNSSRIVQGTGSHTVLSVSMNIIHPFSWAATLDWTNLTKAMGSDRQIVQIWKPDQNRFKAMFYSQHQTALTVATTTDSLVLQHLLSYILNGISYPGFEDLSIVYRWMAQMPRRAVLRFFQTLPTESVDVIRQRIRVAAKGNGDADTVQSILELEYDLCTSTPYSKDDVLFILDAIKTFRSSIEPVVKVLVEYASRISPDQDLVLQEVQKHTGFAKTVGHLQMMWIPLRAGAIPTKDCFVAARYDITMLYELVALGNKSIFDWIQEGLLTTAINSVCGDSACERTLVEWILSLLNNSMKQGLWTECEAPDVSSSLVHALQAALGTQFHWITANIYDTCCELGYEVGFCYKDPQLNSTVMQACSNRDWGAAHKAVATAAFTAHTQPTPYIITSRGKPLEELEKALRAQDFHLIKKLMCTGGSDITQALKLALNSGFDDAAALIATYGLEQTLYLLESGSIRTLSRLLCQYSHLHRILPNMNHTNAYDDLDDWLYRRSLHKDCDHFPCCSFFPGPHASQVVLRILSYHAIYWSDIGMLDWLCDRGLALEGICIEYFGDEIYGMDTVPSQRGKFLGHIYNADQTQLPSLLEIAIQHNNMDMVKYFLTRNSKNRDSNALLHAIKSRSQPTLVQILLQDRSTGDARDKVQYGSAALRVAIRDQNYSLIRELSGATDIHGLERLKEEEGCLDYVDPLGEAILRDDCTAARILLENGGDSNAIVAFDGLKGHTPRSTGNSILLRMTALLVAIDIGNLSMVQLLVDNGANVNHESNMGLLRTPLQRAAEIGDFDLVQYFIAQGAVVNTVPVYGGGTALQLAAMSGHVGIATLLIENGANVNYPPARGPGRTAFEAAAEWCRPDMMHLLVQYGVQLDLEVVGEVEEEFETDDPNDIKMGIDFRWRTVRTVRTQYERAIQFAEDRGEHVSKRIVQRLRRELLGDLHNSFLDIQTQTQSIPLTDCNRDRYESGLETAWRKD